MAASANTVRRFELRMNFSPYDSGAGRLLGKPMRQSGLGSSENARPIHKRVLILSRNFAEIFRRSLTIGTPSLRPKQFSRPRRLTAWRIGALMPHSGGTISRC
jgi:hypothetical protein